jgi:hypothetical protein
MDWNARRFAPETRLGGLFPQHEMRIETAFPDYLDIFAGLPAPASVNETAAFRPLMRRPADSCRQADCSRCDTNHRRNTTALTGHRPRQQRLHDFEAAG